MLAQDTTPDVLHAAGPAVVCCSRTAGRAAASVPLVAALDQRGWTGGAELIAELEAVRDGTSASLTGLAVDGDQVGEALGQLSASASYIDFDSGVVRLPELIELGEGPDALPRRATDPSSESRGACHPPRGATHRSRLT